MGMEGGGGGGGGGAKCLPALWGMAAKPCDSCKAAAALLFCRVDSAFLCIVCDSKVHRHARHERVWMCEVCEQAPASVTCKADAAALCVTCDADIHSANPLSHRHERIPVVPFYNSAESVVKSASAAAANNFLEPTDDRRSTHHTCPEPDPPSWAIPNPTHKLPDVDAPDMKSIELLFSDSDQFLDFDCPIGIHNSGSDSVVPVQPMKSGQPPTKQMVEPSPDNYIEIDFTNSKFNSINKGSYTPQSLTQSFSSSSMDVGVVPDGSSMSEISYSYGKISYNDLGGSVNTPPFSHGSDREARVLRYREKRKNRKFEKTIRYASRKAYAETRPRIKGRFAKRTEMAPQLVKRFFHSGPDFQTENGGYGVVPSFL